jgi:uncharacterized HhH-GPD family protein
MTTRTDPTAVATLPWTGVEEADRLIAADANALLIGFCLDQQITVQKAFSGPLTIKERLGTLDPGALAEMEPATVAAAFSRPPAVHRFPRNMADRVQQLCRVIAADYGGDGVRIWTEAADARDLEKRLRGLPGFGAMKARTIINVLGKLLDVRPAGWEAYVPEWMTLGDAGTAEKLAEYQAGKRAYKAQLRAQGLQSDVAGATRPLRRARAPR